ncbi:Alpha/Beta hydrolase protein [Hypoxylon trugodes]|uniref:Alpha/Beta hydrolase protein n=1 Tax=Hypoxylon trugodes TaxID=326681 RepID=UPI002194FC46|nr:Alpha/Beta hydrolase protein [Hypoxylon trugodes]KAI1393149.1 Alpha/Beta hydrolase protein [Hypoxylon trugodes]
MEKSSSPTDRSPESESREPWPIALAIVCLIVIGAISSIQPPKFSYEGFHQQYYNALTSGAVQHCSRSPYGQFPLPDDPFHFIPCTNATIPPALDDSNPDQSWAHLFDPNPDHWSWGNATTEQNGHHEDPYAGRGIYLCGYLDVPLDHTNESDTRIVRLAVTKYQVSGLAQLDGAGLPRTKSAGSKSERTIVIEPGGPGGSGTSYAWRAAEDVTKRLSDGKFDVLGWDPRGVNITSPSVACFPYNADRDRWSMLTGQYREVSGSPETQLELADAMNNATFRACLERHGDLPRFIGTAFVARDMEEIRKNLGEDELTGYLVSYGTGIGQTWANMFPDSVGRVILDGTEYVRDHRLLGGFGWTALDNATDAWRDGFLGECLNAGPEYCALSRPRGSEPVSLQELEIRMKKLVVSISQRPVPGYLDSSGPSLITYSSLVSAIYSALYNAKSWPSLAQMLYELEASNSTLATAMLERAGWEYDPTLPSPPSPKPSTDELGALVICADSYDAPLPPEGLVWWNSLWANMSTQAWISGNSRFFNVFPCRHFPTYWPQPAEVYRGDLNHTLKNPVLLIAETYDPATPLRNGRRLLNEMGKNARLVVHHGYGHSSRDKSSCTDSIAKTFILNGTLPDEQETPCYADEKPYLYGVNTTGATAQSIAATDPIQAWREHIEELALWNPRLLPTR